MMMIANAADAKPTNGAKYSGLSKSDKPIPVQNARQDWHDSGLKRLIL
jgi:hypothetical protein